MSESALAPLFTWLRWAFVPGWATSTLQSVYYKVTVPVGQSPPRPGTPLFIKHHRRIRVLVLTLYLLYTLLQSLYDIKLAGDFFTWLVVTPSSSDREIKSKFRRLAAKYHPDKIRNGADVENLSSTDTNFLTLKLAQDTLLNPTLRYAYTRFGPTIVTVPIPAALKPSIRTYVFAGLRHNLLPTYLINIASLTVLNYFVLPKWGTFWRYYVLTFIFAIELYFLTHSDPSFSALLPNQISSLIVSPSIYVYDLLLTYTKLQHLLPPHLLPYQTLTVLRRLSMSLNIFISQLAPPDQQAILGAGSNGNKNPNINLLSTVNQSLTHLNQAAARTDAESTALLSLQLTPYKSNREKIDRLREGMREGIVRGALTANPDVKTAIERANERRRATSQTRASTLQ